MALLRIYCACGVRLDVVTETRWWRGGVVPARSGRTPADRAIAAVQPLDLDAWGRGDEATRHGGRRRTSPDWRTSYQRWEWHCGGCGAHRQAREDRLSAALAAGRARLDFGVDL